MGTELLEKAWIEFMPGEKMPPVKKNKKGKPYFRGGSRHLSISHTGNFWACVFSDGLVGLDIQELKPAIPIEKIARRFFTPKETDLIIEKGEEAFYALWTRREAVGKLLGTGFFIPPKSDKSFFVEYFRLEEKVVGALATTRKEKIWMKKIN